MADLDQQHDQLTEMDTEAAGPGGESKEDKFKRLGVLRATNVLKALRILGGLSNTTTYSYTQEQVDQMFGAIQKQIDKVREGFAPVKKTKDDTDFSF
jgi:hypothetical protein